MPYRWVILAVTMTAQASVTVIQQGMAALAPFFQSAFHLSRAGVGLLTVSVTAGSILAMLVGGLAVDRFGERTILALTGVGIGVTTMAAAAANTAAVLAALLVVAGLWSATAATAGSKAVMGWFPARRRGLAMSLRQTGVPLGGALAAALLPAIAARHGWPAALLAAGLLAIAAACLLFVLYRDYPQQARAPRQTDRVPLRALLANREIMLTTAVAMCYSFGQWAVIGFMELYSKETLSVPLATASALLAAAQLSGAAARAGWGLLSDTALRGSRVRALRACGLGGAIMALVTAQLVHGTPLWLIAVVAVLFGAAAIGWNGLYITLVSELAGHARAGAALGLSLTFVFTTITAAPPLFGLLVDRSGSYALAWRLLAIILALGTVLTWLIREDRRQA